MRDMALLHQRFEDLAIETWDKLANAYQYNFSFSEESITDDILLKLVNLASPNIQIVKYEKHEEAQLGADWDMWIGSDSTGWIRYLIQAKKLDLGAGWFGSLRHSVKVPAGGSKFQIDILHEFAQKTGGVPVYCLYCSGENFRETVGSKVVPSDHYSKVLYKIYGCSIADFDLMNKIHQKYETKQLVHFFDPNRILPWCYLIINHNVWVKDPRLVAHPFARHADGVTSSVVGKLPTEVTRLVRGEITLSQLLQNPDQRQMLYPDSIVPRGLAVVKMPKDADK